MRDEQGDVRDGDEDEDRDVEEGDVRRSRLLSDLSYVQLHPEVRDASICHILIPCTQSIDLMCRTLILHYQLSIFICAFSSRCHACQ